MRTAANVMFAISILSAAMRGSSVLAFDRIGWSACVAGLAVSLTLAGLLAFRLKMTAPRVMAAQPA